MKKLLISACALCIAISAVNANEQIKKEDAVKKDIKVEKCMPKRPAPDHVQKIKKAHEAAFEQKLGLTEVQKLKARELRKEGHEKIKPVMKDIKAKKFEAEAIRNSKLAVEEKEQKLTAIDKDLETLQKQAKEIRKQNMKEFESILTKEQKKTLKNMKKEGRKNFDKQRKELPPPPCKPVFNK